MICDRIVSDVRDYNDTERRFPMDCRPSLQADFEWREVWNIHFFSEKFCQAWKDDCDHADCTDFGPVSIAFAVACGVTSLSCVYTFWYGRKQMRKTYSE